MRHPDELAAPFCSQYARAHQRQALEVVEPALLLGEYVHHDVDVVGAPTGPRLALGRTGLRPRSRSACSTSSMIFLTGVRCVPEAMMK